LASLFPGKSRGWGNHSGDLGTRISDISGTLLVCPGPESSQGGRGARWAVLLAAGAIIAVAIEFHALGTDRWAYTSLMPLVPYAEVGLSPFVQLLLLPYLSMIWARRIYSVE